jgi:hypothetical protein
VQCRATFDATAAFIMSGPMAAAPEDNRSRTGPRAPVAGTAQCVRFAPPRLYPLTPDAINQVFQSRLGAAPIEVRVPESRTHAIQPASGSSAPAPDAPRSSWIVPRSLEITIPAGTDTQDPGFATALRGWWTLTTDWLAAWVGEAPGGDIPTPRLVQPRDTDASETPTPSGFMMLYGLAGEAHASSDQFAHALQLAGEGAEPPPAYMLLQRAQSADTLAQHRVAAMEACSAAEVAAGNAIEQALIKLGCPAKFADGVLRRARGIRAAHGVLLELDVPCGIEKADVTHLAEVRNAAAHGAGHIGSQDAQRAVTDARTLVSTLLGPATPLTRE